MIVRLLSIQIPQFWDIIKYAVQQVEKIGIDETEESFNLLFASLLSDKSQCFIKYSEELPDRVVGILITEILENRLSGERAIRLRVIYVFKAFNQEDWKNDFKFLTDLAISEKCSKIVFESSNKRIVEVSKSVGFKESFVTMEIQI